MSVRSPCGCTRDYCPTHQPASLAGAAASATAFDAWEAERPQAFLEHATRATRQYDAQYRSMAAEILALRADRQRRLAEAAASALCDAAEDRG